MNKKKRCEVCGEEIFDKVSYMKTKVVCQRCYDRFKMNRRLARGRPYQIQEINLWKGI